MMTVQAREARKSTWVCGLLMIAKISVHTYMSPNIDTNDLNTKVSAARKFIAKGNKVKVSIRFRGREMAHTNDARPMMDDFAEKLSDIAIVDKPPKMEGRFMSVDRGQMEAGRSLGFSYSRTMLYVILPQAFKNVLPALGNEFITLLKETSVSGYIAVSDLTKAGDIIRSRTFSAFMPLIAVALIYLFFVLIFTKLVSILERRLRESDH